MRNARFKPHRSKRGVGYAALADGGDVTYALRSAAGRPLGDRGALSQEAAAQAAREAARGRKRRFVGEVR